MSRSRTRALVAALAMAVGTVATSASAAILGTAAEVELFSVSIDPRSYTVQNDDGTLTHIVDTQSTVQEVLTFDKFDPQLGTLISVALVSKSTLTTLNVLNASLGTSAKVTFSSNSQMTALLTGTGFIT